VEPEIPPNTGNVIRLCANTGARLHLVKPLGFSMDARGVRRAGLDYHELAAVQVHDDLAACLRALGDARLFLIETGASRRYSEMRFQRGDALFFGSETRGATAAVRAAVAAEYWLSIPMANATRSLNLSNCVALVLYEAWRQLDFGG
ncbi:MAG: tRNA (cytidine(34)-2'-O)-methyltransferase, partial [Proteobacteria bacterium]|nr:tRNA (cytidine(34)-2'-O)-methyltransferase [Pseudomonadota bacterium]